MVTVGVQTKGILPECGPIQGAEIIAKAGFERVDFNLDCFLTNKEVYQGKSNRFFDRETEVLTSEFMEYRKALSSHGLHTSQMHAPYPVYVFEKDEISRYMQQVVIPKSIAIAGVMEVPWVVMHPFKMQFTGNLKKEQESNLAFFTSLIPLLKEHNVRICVENLYESIGGRIMAATCADPGEAIFYVDTLNEIAGEERFGICMDLGHLQLVHRDPVDYIRRVGKRLKIMHLHENNDRDDLHHMPYTFGRGRDDGRNWDDVIEALAQIDYDGTLSFETFPSMNSFPRSSRDEALRMICAIGNHWRERIEEKKACASVS